MTGKTYLLDRIVDLLQVPSDLRMQCVKELLLVLELAEFADADLLGPMEWTDDGNPSCTLRDEDGNDHLSVHIRKK